MKIYDKKLRIKDVKRINEYANAKINQDIRMKNQIQGSSYTKTGTPKSEYSQNKFPYSGVLACNINKGILLFSHVVHT